MQLENKLKNWIKNKAINEMSKPKKRLDESLSLTSFYKSLYQESPLIIDYKKLFF